MATATVKRDSTSVDIPLIESGSGTPLVGVDYGKPNVDIKNSGVLDPRVTDQWSGLRQYTILGKLQGSNAYSDAITLADSIKSHSAGSNTTLNIDMPEYDTDIRVCPAAGQDQALTMNYPPGWKDYVEVELALTRVVDTTGAGSGTASTPTASGTGPIQIKYNGNTVDITADVEVERNIGRPRATVRRTQRDYPKYIDKEKAASDTFGLSFDFTSNVQTKLTTLTDDIFTPQTGRSGIKIDFQGKYGLGEFDVIPSGSGALRHVRPSGHGQVTFQPTLDLQVITPA